MRFATRGKTVGPGDLRPYWLGRLPPYGGIGSGFVAAILIQRMLRRRFPGRAVRFSVAAAARSIQAPRATGIAGPVRRSPGKDSSHRSPRQAEPGASHEVRSPSAHTSQASLPGAASLRAIPPRRSTRVATRHSPSAATGLSSLRFLSLAPRADLPQIVAQEALPAMGHASPPHMSVDVTLPTAAAAWPGRGYSDPDGARGVTPFAVFLLPAGGRPLPVAEPTCR